VIGDEHILDDDRVAAGAGEARCAPIAEILHVPHRHQEQARVRLGPAVDRARDGDLISCIVHHRRAEHDPGAVIAARGERPAAGEHVTAFDLLRLAARREHRADVEIGIGA
jgi:hypothetical protein